MDSPHSSHQGSLAYSSLRSLMNSCISVSPYFATIFRTTSIACLAKELRSKFDAGVAKVNAEVAKATADGTVTKEEAGAVRKLSRELRGHHGKHARHGEKKDHPKR